MSTPLHSLNHSLNPSPQPASTLPHAPSPSHASQPQQLHCAGHRAAARPTQQSELHSAGVSPLSGAYLGHHSGPADTGPVRNQRGAGVVSVDGVESRSSRPTSASVHDGREGREGREGRDGRQPAVGASVGSDLVADRLAGATPNNRPGTLRISMLAGVSYSNIYATPTPHVYACASMHAYATYAVSHAHAYAHMITTAECTCSSHAHHRDLYQKLHIPSSVLVGILFLYIPGRLDRLGGVGAPAAAAGLRSTAPRAQKQSGRR